jgi:hypothetical protein
MYFISNNEFHFLINDVVNEIDGFINKPFEVTLSNFFNYLIKIVESVCIIVELLLQIQRLVFVFAVSQ